MVNVPIVQDKLAVSGSFAWRSTPGWVDTVNNAALKDQNDYEQRGGRAALLWTPTPEFSVKLAGIWQSLDFDGNALYAADLTGQRLGDGRSFNNFVPESYDIDLDYYSATLDYDFGAATLTSATTYSKTQSAQLQDASYAFGVLFPLLTGGAVPPGITPFSLDLGLKKWTQEVRLASPSGGQFEWLIGGFFTDETTSNAQLVRSFDMAGNPIPGLDPLAIVGLPATYKEYAIFGNGTFKLSEQFEITGGLRWARNKQTFRQISSGAIVPQADDPGKSAESVFTYSISPQFHINDDAMLYARLATGYRPGGPNVIVPNVPPTVDADRMKNYEIGSEGRLRRSFGFGRCRAVPDGLDRHPGRALVRRRVGRCERRQGTEQRDRGQLCVASDPRADDQRHRQLHRRHAQRGCARHQRRRWRPSARGTEIQRRAARRL